MRFHGLTLEFREVPFITPPLPRNVPAVPPLSPTFSADRSTLSRRLKRATQQGLICCLGSGYRGDGFRYWLPGHEPLLLARRQGKRGREASVASALRGARARLGRGLGVQVSGGAGCGKEAFIRWHPHDECPVCFPPTRDYLRSVHCEIEGEATKSASGPKARWRTRSTVSWSALKGDSGSEVEGREWLPEKGVAFTFSL